MTYEFILYLAINTVVVLATAPLFVSLIKKVKAWTQGRQGPSVFQTYYTLTKLLKKEVIYASASSRIMRVTPLVNMAAMLVAALFVPLVFVPEPVGGIGNIILFLYLLALAKFFMALAGLDAGSSFGGMGSSREMSISAIIEPTTIIVFAALAFVFKTLNIFDMFALSAASGTTHHPDPDPCRDLPFHHPHRRDLTDTGGQPGDTPGTDHDPRGNDPRTVRPEPGPHGTLRRSQAHHPHGTPRQPHPAVRSCHYAWHCRSLFCSSPLCREGCSPCRDHRPL